MCETLIIFALFGAVSSKQHTINTIYLIMNDSKEIFAIN